MACELTVTQTNAHLSGRDVMRGQKLSVSLTNPATSSPTGFVNADENGNIKTGKEAGESRSGYRQARTWGGKGQGWPISGDTGILCDCARH
jgi:hypothetical protein